MKNFFLLIIISLLSIILISFSYYYFSIYWIKKNGVFLKPTKNISVIKVPYYLQNDSLWASEKIGDSPHRLGGSGCLIACLSSVCSHLTSEINPLELNKLFSSKEIYTNSGEIIWNKIHIAIPSIDYCYEKIFDTKLIQRDLEQKEIPIVKVKYLNDGVFHWVLIVGATDNDFLIMDPLENSKTFVPLSKHGKCYAYRKLILTISQ